MTELICDLGQCAHMPIRPPRKGHHGEEVFAMMWAAHMAKEGGMWDDYHSNVSLQHILQAGDSLDERMASVAATFVQWLGTNCGRGFIAQARKLASGPLMERGFIAEWACENHRYSWQNSGYRAIEHILAPDECFKSGQLAYAPDLSASDYETVESVVQWLGTSEGAKFVDTCFAEISDRVLAEDISSAVERRDFIGAKLLLGRVKL